MATINSTPIKQKVYGKNSDGTLSPISNWVLSDTVEMEDGTFLSEYVKNIGKGSTIFLVKQEDTTDIDTAVSSLDVEEIMDGQILIISNSKNENVGYVYSTNNSQWVAFSGNVNADSVYFNSDIICAGNYTQVGNVSKSSTGTTTISSAGKSLTQVMTNIFTKELQPTKTNPTINVTLAESGTYEVGTSIEPHYSMSFNEGTYTYDSSTGVVFSDILVKDSNAKASNNISGSFESFVVSDSTDYKLTVTANYSDGSVAKTNLGNTSNPVVQITSSSASNTSRTITGYRPLFYGILDNTNTIDSAVIRSLTNGGKLSHKTFTISVNGDTQAKRIIVAIPTNSNFSIISVSKTDGLVTDITSTYSKIGTVNVDGKNNMGSYASYDVWCYQPAVIDKNEVHEITI